MLSRRKTIILTLSFFLVLLFTHANASPTEPDTLRIGLVRYFRGITQATINASSNFSIIRTGTSDIIASDKKQVTIALDKSNLSLKNDDISSTGIGASVSIIPNDPSAIITIDSPNRSNKQYHGTLEINVRDNALQLVNIVGLDDYLSSVLSCEVGGSFPTEALKAQAIAARNYALIGRRAHDASGYDLCDDTHCQVYDGVAREKSACIQAVMATKGQILTYNGRPASVMYSADCGGITQDYSECYSNRTYPYLCSITDPPGIYHASWEVTYTLQELADKLIKAGVKEAGGLQKINIIKVSQSQRVLSVQITGAQETATIPGGKIRSILGRDGIKSTMFTIESNQDGTVTFKGKGFGHGIGLCQTGAKALANPPFNYTCEQILAHYFPGTTLTPGIASAAVAMTKPVQVIAPKKINIPPTPAKGAGPPPKKKDVLPFDVRVKEPSL